MSFVLLGILNLQAASGGGKYFANLFSSNVGSVIPRDIGYALDGRTTLYVTYNDTTDYGAFVEVDTDGTIYNIVKTNRDINNGFMNADDTHYYLTVHTPNLRALTQKISKADYSVTTEVSRRWTLSDQRIEGVTWQNMNRNGRLWVTVTTDNAGAIEGTLYDTSDMSVVTRQLLAEGRNFRFFIGDGGKTGFSGQEDFMNSWNGNSFQNFSSLSNKNFDRRVVGANSSNNVYISSDNSTVYLYPSNQRGRVFKITSVFTSPYSGFYIRRTSGAEDNAGWIRGYDDNNIYVANRGYNYSYLTKIDADGNIIWAKRFALSGSDIRIQRIDFDADGDLLLLVRDVTNNLAGVVVYPQDGSIESSGTFANGTTLTIENFAMTNPAVSITNNSAGLKRQAGTFAGATETMAFTQDLTVLADDKIEL